MASSDRDLRVGCFVLFLGIAIAWASFTMPMRGGVYRKPGDLPRAFRGASGPFRRHPDRAIAEEGRQGPSGPMAHSSSLF